MSWFQDAAFHIRTLLLMLLFLSGSLTFMHSMLSKVTILPNTATEPCQGVRPVDQVVLILFDALRPDFVLPALSRRYSDGEECAVNGSRQSGGGPLSSTLKYIEENLRDTTHPSHGFFYLADTPTATAQRIKAIVTGTVPAFLEAGANLNTEEVLSDSLLRQLRRRSILLGDDTWLNLFPDDGKNSSLWKRTIAYPPFNVSDFDSNDENVMANLLPLLESETVEQAPHDYAKLIVAHFLGIDHIGHRHHSQHPSMGVKLAALDESLRNMSRVLRHQRQSATRTLVLVFGDHGMTNSGDHGGDSYQETDTFLYAELFDGNDSSAESLPPEARRRKADMTQMRWRENIDIDLERLKQCRNTAGVHPDKLSAAHQVDTTPTIAALLGIPIPFSSIGRILPEIVALADAEADIEALEACNWRQVASCIEESKVPMKDSWIDDNLPLRERVAQMSYFARKTRNAMGRLGMFVGSCLFMIAFLSFLWAEDTQKCLRCESLVGLWALLLFFFRVCAVFANSFVLKEYVEVLCLGQLLLVAVLMATPRWRLCINLATLLSSLRLLVPLFCRDRSHITHVADAASPLQGWMDVNAPDVRWEVWGTFAGAVAGFCLLSPRLFHRLWVVVLFVAMAVSYKQPVLHHVVPLGFFLLASLMRGSAALRYITITLWASSLCNENFLASAAIAVHGAVLPFVVRTTRHIPVVPQAVLLHLLSWVAFFAQGNQCLFNTLDLNASFVGLPANNLMLSTLFVMSRTFIAFVLAPMATMLAYEADRARGWRVCYFLVYLAVLQSSLSCFNGYIQKTHLMLFSIYCPKLMFDVVICAVTGLGYLIALLVI
ncbi:ethanolamine phosphotransferase [Trypanosoma grayi]|uniref:ethanolamine phosphotransferase n=1 Tax=Trypanosoma grayi TaxID=71804 RepID=UPI0004F4A20D|nr:ethanolamine phosphotransferase [Trypanosoma grayi]KEG11473.1 ethanolamine phosphotransferase [Trypanosoma grayi]